MCEYSHLYIELLKPGSKANASTQKFWHNARFYAWHAVSHARSEAFTQQEIFSTDNLPHRCFWTQRLFNTPARLKTGAFFEGRGEKGVCGWHRFQLEVRSGLALMTQGRSVRTLIALKNGQTADKKVYAAANWRTFDNIWQMTRTICGETEALPCQSMSRR